MAIYNGRILMRKGNEADFDASKLYAGEWAVSLDAGIVRICLEAGKVIRMATYEAFEEDMKQIEAILLECQTIEEAVQRINTEINAKVDAVVEYVGQAKTYRDEAKTFRDEAEAFKNQAGEIAGIDIATTEKAGIVKPDGETLEVDADGTMRVIGGGGVSDYSELENKPSINNVELYGNKTLEDLGVKPHALTNPTNNLLATEAGTALDAVQGKALNDYIKTMVYTDVEVEDLNTVTNALCETSKNTLNTPNTEGVSSATQYFVITTNQQNSYSTQIAFTIGNADIFIRSKANNSWGKWGNKIITETALNNSLKPIDVPYTVNTEKVEVTSGLMTIKKSGYIVNFTMVLKSKVNLSGTDNLIRITNYAPLARYDITGRFGVDTLLPLVMYTDGRIDVNSVTIPENTYLFISGSYITNTI